MPLDAEAIEDRVDLDRVDVPGTLRQRDGDIVAAPRPDDEHVPQWIVRDAIVGHEAERLVRLHERHGHDPLMGSAVDLDADASLRVGRGDRDPLVRGPIGPGRERQHAEDDQDHGQGSEVPSPARLGHEDEGDRDDPAPRERRGVDEREDRERDDAEDAAEDVEAVGLEALEPANTRATPPAIAAITRKESTKITDRESHLGSAGHPKPPTTWSTPSTRPPCTGKTARNTTNASEPQRGESEQIASAVGAEEPHAHAQEARQQDEVREERDVDVVRAGPSDEPQLHEQHQEAQDDEPDVRPPGERRVDGLCHQRLSGSISRPNDGK